MVLPEVAFKVSCSKGTYIRSLCADIGDKLGCGAAMKSLKRTRVGSFLVEDSLTLAQIEEAMAKSCIDDYVLASDAVFMDYLGATVKPEFDKVLANGNKLIFHSLSWKKIVWYRMGKWLESIAVKTFFQEYMCMKRRQGA